MNVVVLTLVMMAVVVAVAMSLRHDKEAMCPSKCFCSKTGSSVNCNGKKLTTIPDGIPPQVETLYLDNNLFSSLGQGALSNFSHLTKVYLRNNLISDIKPLAFRNLPQLTDVYLTNNKISGLHVDVFAEVGTVTYLNLGANEMTAIPDLRYLHKLETLVLEANRISNATFPPESTNLTALNAVVLSNNKILQLTNQTFEALRNSSVRKLEISRNGLKNVSTGALKPLVALQSLKIGNNPLDGPQLQHVLQGLRDDTNLESLDIRNISLGGTLPSLSFSILSKTPLKTLIFKNNRVHNIPPNAFAHLPQLKQLYLSACHIRSVDPAAFVDLPDLQLLFLNENGDLTEVPDNLPASLLKLYLQGNNIDVLPAGKFTKLNALRELYFSNNKMHQVAEDSFVGLSNLRILHLNNNMLSYIPKRLFAPLTSLNTLVLKNNALKTLKENPGSLSSLVALTTLDMSSNQCSYIPLDYLSELTSLQNLLLDNNNLRGLFAADVGGQLLGNLRKLQRLNISNNDLIYIHDAQFRHMFDMRHLNLRNNQLSSWGSTFFKAASGTLRTVDLSYNQVALVNATSVQDLSHVTSLNLSMNPFACTCDLVWFCDWINKTSVQLLDVTHYKCNSPSDWNSKPLMTFCEAHIDCRDYTWYYVGSAIGGTFVFVVIIAIILYRQRWFLLLRFYRMQKRIRRTCRGAKAAKEGYAQIQGDDKKYDYYIVASQEDMEFVRDELLPKLDNQFADEEQVEGDTAVNRFKLYFEERDAIPGKHKIKNWDDDIPSCRAVLVVLTKNLIEDDWCHDFLLAQAEQMRMEGTIDRVQIVMVGRVPPKYIPKRLQRAIEKGDYFEWPNRETVEAEFVEKLRDVLQPHRHVQHV